MANQEHLDLLLRSVAKNEENTQFSNHRLWNLWRADHPDVKPDLSGANLSNMNLKEANLFHANLSDTNCEKTHLYEGSLHKANLSGANLREANLYNASLGHANLSGANLREANLRKAALNDTILDGANLDQALLMDIFGYTVAQFAKAKNLHLAKHIPGALGALALHQLLEAKASS